jgi:hypothetical protein
MATRKHSNNRRDALCAVCAEVLGPVSMWLPQDRLAYELLVVTQL